MHEKQPEMTSELRLKHILVTKTKLNNSQIFRITGHLCVCFWCFDYLQIYIFLKTVLKQFRERKAKLELHR